MINSILHQLNQDKEVKWVSETYELPSGITCRIVDYRTKSHIDDIYYKKTKSLLLRRGLAAVYCPAASREPAYLLTGMPKFGNEDDNFTEKLPEDKFHLTRRVYMVKENGEAGHLAFFRAAPSSKWCAIIGSKNVHIVISVASEDEAKKDIDFYASLKSIRLTGAVANARLLLRFHSGTLFSNDDMKGYLAKNQLTLVFEAIFDNHIVKYDDEAVIAFALAEPQFKPLQEQGLVMMPEWSLERFRQWGFRTPTVDISEPEKFQEFDRKYETLQNSEGAVVYEVFTNLASGQEILGRIYKHKNHVYIIRRMAREQIKRKSVYTGWQKRFANCHIDTKGLESEINHLLAFYVWLAKTKRKLMNSPQSGWANLIQENFKDMFAAFESKFGKDSEEIETLLAQAPSTLTSGDDEGEETFAILLVGLQGCGKTLLRNGLVEVLGQEKVTYVNQDELGGERKAFLRELRDTKKSAGKVMIVDKCNHTYQLREDVYSSYSKVLICEFLNTNDSEGEQMTAICYERIRQRGINHLTLPFSSNLPTIISRCSEAYEPVSEAEKQINDYLTLNVVDAPEVNLNRILKYLQENGFIASDLKFDLEELACRIRDVQTKYESRIRKEALKRCKYWRASADVEAIHQFFKPIAPKIDSLKFKWDEKFDENSWRHEGEEYHVTLVYDRKLSEKEANTMLGLGELRVRATSLAFNEKCAAIRLVREGQLLDLCEKENPHITLGCAEGVPAAFANEMLESGQFEEIPCDFELKLIINPVF